MIVNARIPNSGKETQSTAFNQYQKQLAKWDHDDVPQLDQGAQENSLAS